MDKGHVLHIVFVLLCLEQCTSGEFRLRPSTTTSLRIAHFAGTSCGERDALYTCFMRCVTDPCCVAVKLSPGPCQIAYLPTEDMDIVKETAELPSFEECSCMVECGGLGGYPFSLQAPFAAAPSPIVQITVYTNQIDGLWGDISNPIVPVGLRLRYASGHEGSHGAVWEFPHTCDLAAGERIQRVTVYNWPSDVNIVIGIRFHTTLQICGTYGTETTRIQEAEGHELLYLAGRSGDLIDALHMAFDHSCTLTAQGM